jgi:hypothetical protein
MPTRHGGKPAKNAMTWLRRRRLTMTVAALQPPHCGVCGLDYTFTLARTLGAARLVSLAHEQGILPGKIKIIVR